MLWGFSVKGKYELFISVNFFVFWEEKSRGDFCNFFKFFRFIYFTSFFKRNRKNNIRIKNLIYLSFNTFFCLGSLGVKQNRKEFPQRFRHLKHFEIYSTNSPRTTVHLFA